MSNLSECEQTLLVQADFDGELEAGRAAALVEHVAQCPHCQLVSDQLARSRALLRAAPRYSVPRQLQDSIERTLQASVSSTARSSAQPRATSRSAMYGWAAALAASMVLAIMLLTPRSPDVQAQLVASHVRSLQLESHLIDVPSSDHHTVRPWFAGKVDFAPLVKELGGDGFPLKGGRVDVVDGRAVSVLVYQAGRHVVAVYMWPEHADATSLLRSQQVDGFNMRQWREGGLVVSCISDLAADELQRFEQRWRAR
ncbi:MAG TPA: zf-HC2 domain-containing protein [Steroidobacteraceae bacterium]|nr:zf-HC2 domain-containing protein [Steroidobacteraceae bacterium]